MVGLNASQAAASGAALLAPAAALAEDPDNTINPTDAIVQASPSRGCITANLFRKYTMIYGLNCWKILEEVDMKANCCLMF